MGERIKTLHPEGKQGVNIDKAKYDAVAAAILAAIGAALWGPQAHPGVNLASAVLVLLIVFIAFVVKLVEFLFA